LLSLPLILMLAYLGTATSDVPYAGVLNILGKVAIVIFFLVSLYNLLDSNQQSRVFRYLQEFKDCSFFLFAIHMFLFTAVQRSLLRIGLESYQHNQFFVLGFNVVSLLIVLVLSLTMGRLLKKKLPKFFYFITGR